MWLDVKDDVPPRALHIVGPRVVTHHDAMIFSVAAGRDHRAAIAWRVRRNFYRQASQEILWAKIYAEFQTEIDGISAIVKAADDAVNLGLELRVDLRPKNFLRRLAIEVPIVLRLMLQKRPQHAQQVLRLFSQQGTVLIANFVGRAFEVHVNPAVALKAVAPLQTIVLGASRFVLSEAKGADHQ